MTISSRTDDSATSKCIECGAATSLTAKFCGECGASQSKRAPRADFYPSNDVGSEWLTLNLDLQDAIEHWLTAREQCSCGYCRKKLEPFTNNAANMLYAAFSEDWQGDEGTLHVAFEQFCEALVADDDWGYRHREVSVVYSNRSM